MNCKNCKHWERHEEATEESAIMLGTCNHKYSLEYVWDDNFGGLGDSKVRTILYEAHYGCKFFDQTSCNQPSGFDTQNPQKYAECSSCGCIKFFEIEHPFGKSYHCYDCNEPYKQQ